MAPNLIAHLYSLHRLRRSQWIDSSWLKKLQSERLKSLLRHAYYQVDYYRELFDRAGISLGDIKDIHDLVKIPVSTRKDLQALPKEKILAKDVDLKSCVNVRTSGSTGMPLDIFLGAREIASRQLFYRRMYFENGGRLTDREVKILSHRNFAGNEWFQYLGILKIKNISIFDDIEKQLKLILEFKPQIIEGYASTLKNLAIEIRKKGIKGIKPRIIFSTAELLTRQNREFLASVFQGELFDYYACNECGTIAWECKEHFGYHINSEHVIVELIKEDDSNANAGEEGEVVITSLNSYAMPFIRYKLGDIGILSDEKCPCGRILPLIKIIGGRVNDCIILPGGKRFSPFFLTCEIENIPGIIKYQLLQEKIDTFKLKIVTDKIFSEQIIDTIEKKLKQFLFENIKIEVSIEEDIPEHDKIGKFRTVISQVN